MIAAAESNLKNVTLELGGKNPIIVFDDANIDEAVKWTVHGALYANFPFIVHIAILKLSCP